MTCPNCGLDNPPSARFCANCGTTLSGAAPPPPQPPPPPQYNATYNPAPGPYSQPSQPYNVGGGGQRMTFGRAIGIGCLCIVLFFLFMMFSCRACVRSRRYYRYMRYTHEVTVPRPPIIQA